MYAFIDCNRGRYTVEMMARVLRIFPRSYYDHQPGKHNLREQKCEALEQLIQQVDAPCKVWVSDITYIHTTHGFCYLTSVIGLYDRKVIGWSVSSTMTAANTAVRAYRMAVRSRKPSPGMIFHSDQGVQYTCEELRNALDKNVVQSMSRRGNCRDNAVAESFFKSLKCELIYGNKLLSAKQVDLEIFEYIEIFYNKIRRHSALKNMTIDEFNKLNKIPA